MSSPPLRLRARARVLVTLEISDIGGTWGGDCPTDQVFRQASESAIGLLRNGLANKADWRVVGEPKVTAILAEETR